MAMLILVYFGMLDNPLFFDSVKPLSKNGLTSIRDTWSLLSYRSLTDLTFWIIGPDLKFQHFFNLLLHVANSCLIFIFGMNLVSHSANQVSSSAIWKAFPLAALFAFNPVAPYAVAYLVQRYVLMATFFSLLACISLNSGLRNSSIPSYIFSVIFYAAALRSKEHSAAIIFVFILQAWIHHRGKVRDQTISYRRLVIFFVVCSLFATEIFLRMRGVIGTMYEPLAESLVKISPDAGINLNGKNLWSLSMISQSWLFLRYVGLWIFPDPQYLAIDYQVPFPDAFFSFPEILGPPMFLLFGVAGLYLFKKNHPLKFMGFGLLFPWLLFLTEYSTVRLGEQFVLYRSYLWMSGFFAAAAGTMYHFSVPSYSSATNKIRATYFLLLVIMIMFTLITHERLKTFDSDVTLWQDALAKNTNRPEVSYKMARLHFNLGLAYKQHDDVKNAIHEYEQAIRIDPDHTFARIDLAFLMMRRKDFAAAEKHVLHLIKKDPDYAEGHYLLGNIYRMENKKTDARKHYERTLRLVPDHHQAHLDLGLILMEESNLEGARQHFSRALEIRPGWIPAVINLGNTYIRLKQYETALDLYKTVIQERPDHLEARFNAGLASFKLKRLDEAARHFEVVLKLDPANTKAKQFFDFMRKTGPRDKPDTKATAPEPL